MIARQLLAVLSVLPSLVAVTQPAAAQTVVPDDPLCQECTIALESVVRLGPVGDIPTAPSDVQTDSQGRYWLTFSNEPAMVYSADGRFLMSLKEGAGPGEFRYPWRVLPVGDSVVVFDRQGGPSIVGPDLTVARSVQRSRADGSGFVVAWPDSVLLNVGNRVSPEKVAPFHIVSFEGNAASVLHSFGAQAPPPSNPRAFVNLWRIHTRSGSLHLWATERQKYEIGHWSLQGELDATLLREPEWFPRNLPGMDFNSPPPPHIQALYEDNQGHLWVFISIAAPTWRDGYPKIPAGAGAVEVGPEAFSNEKLYDTTVEVIDPLAGRVTIRATLDSYIVSHIGDDLVAVYNTSEMGEPFVDIVRLVVRR